MVINFWCKQLDTKSASSLFRSYCSRQFLVGKVTVKVTKQSLMLPTWKQFCDELRFWNEKTNIFTGCWICLVMKSFLLGLLWDKIVKIRHIWRPSIVFFLLQRGRGRVGRMKNASKEWNAANNNGTKVKQWQSESHFKSRFKCSIRLNPHPTCDLPQVVLGTITSFDHGSFEPV